MLCYEANRQQDVSDAILLLLFEASLSSKSFRRKAKQNVECNSSFLGYTQLLHIQIFPLLTGGGGGGGFFHSKGTWGCAAREGILFRTSSLAKGVLFGNFSRVRSRQGYAFWEFWSKRCQNSVIFEKKPNFLKILV